MPAPTFPVSRLSRRDWLRAGSLGMAGLSLPDLLAARAETTPTGGSFGQARSCIVLFLLGGPPQHETWDPKPYAPAEIRGDLGPISTSVPGVAVGELMPRTAKLVDRLAVLRACRTGDNAHSTSGYYMTTGVPHVPRQVEGAAPGAPNDHPCLGAYVRRLLPQRGAIPAAVTLPEIAANDGGKTWPGQDAGFLGRAADPWVLGGNASADEFTVPNLTLPVGLSPRRFADRRQLLRGLDQSFENLEATGVFDQYSTWQEHAFDLIHSASARRAFELASEPHATRERYGRSRFGQGVLLARRLVEAGVRLIRVNWTRIAGAPNNGHWDTHGKNTLALRDWLMPRMDQAYSALIEDLESRGLLEETLVVLMGEFGRTPKINGAGGRDHWGSVFSVALAGGGIRPGVVHGVSDRLGAQPESGLVTPPDLLATIYHCLGIPAGSTTEDLSGRELPITRGEPIRAVLL